MKITRLADVRVAGTVVHGHVEGERWRGLGIQTYVRRYFAGFSIDFEMS